MTTPNMLEKLSSLASQRTVRTDRLASLVHDLLRRLDETSEVGDKVTVADCTLRKVRCRSNIGENTFWSWEWIDDEGNDYHCYIDEPVGGDRYMHNDFNVRLRGPTRAALLRFAIRAERIVAAFAEHLETEGAGLDAAAGRVERAALSVR